jgi:ethanolamine transporter EutH
MTSDLFLLIGSFLLFLIPVALYFISRKVDDFYAEGALVFMIVSAVAAIAMTIACWGNYSLTLPSGKFTEVIQK